MKIDDIIARYVKNTGYNASDSLSWASKSVSFHGNTLYSYATAIVKYIPEISMYLVDDSFYSRTTSNHKTIFTSFVKDNAIIYLDSKTGGLKNLRTKSLHVTDINKYRADDIIKIIEENSKMPINKRKYYWQNLKKDIKFLMG